MFGCAPTLLADPSGIRYDKTHHLRLASLHHLRVFPRAMQIPKPSSSREAAIDIYDPRAVTVLCRHFHGLHPSWPGPRTMAESTHMGNVEFMSRKVGTRSQNQ